MSNYVQDGQKVSRVAPTRPIIDIEISDVTNVPAVRLKKTGSGTGDVATITGPVTVVGAVVATTVNGATLAGAPIALEETSVTAAQLYTALASLGLVVDIP